MKPELAELLAATADDDLPVDRAKAVIEEYLRRLAECSYCGGTGRFTFAQGMRLELTDGPGLPVKEQYVSEGTRATCPGCADNKFDPAFFGWHCFHDDPKDRCQRAKDRGDVSGGDHSACGGRVLVPLPKPPAKPSE